MKLQATPFPDWRTYLLRRRARAYSAGTFFAANAAQFPWIALVWPTAPRTPTWRALLRACVCTSNSNTTLTAFWAITNAAFATTLGTPAVQDDGQVGPLSPSLCQLGTFSSAVVSVGNPLRQTVVPSAYAITPLFPFEWIVGSAVPAQLAAGFALAFVISCSAAASQAVVSFDWVEIP